MILLKRKLDNEHFDPDVLRHILSDYDGKKEMLSKLFLLELVDQYCRVDKHNKIENEKGEK